MTEYPCWLWRFSPTGCLEFARCNDYAQWKRARTEDWERVSPDVVSQRLQLLAELYQQDNLYLLYQQRHTRPTMMMEPENFQLLYRATGAPMLCTPHSLLDIANTFVLPVSYFLLPRIKTVPRPLDGLTNHRWDRMSTVQPTFVKDYIAPLTKARPPQERPNWLTFDAEDSARALEVLVQEDTSLLLVHRAPRLYVISYTLPNQQRQMIVLETTKQRARDALFSIHPDAQITGIVSSLAVAGLGLDQAHP